MKYYCVERDECGWFERSEKPITEEDIYCPNCFAPILRYTNNYTPIFEQERPDRRLED